MFRKSVLVFIAVMICASVSYAYSGSGSSTDPYVIESYSDFVYLMQGSEATSSTGNYFKLSCDIQLAGYSNWEPAGTLDTPFTGHFDGQGHTIYINIAPLPLTTGSYIRMTYDRSLFGIIESNGDAVVNLDVEGIARGYNAGGIASVLKAGNIRNCSFSGDITVTTSPSGETAMKYLIEELEDDDIQTADHVEILDDVITKTREYGKINAGGIAAVMLGGEIDNCTFRGNVTAEANLTPANAGGIVGRMMNDSEAISGCYVEGDSVITASTADNDYDALANAGGIAGYANTQLDSTIDSCKFDGTVNSTYYAGGIAGLVRGTILADNTITSTATVSGTYSAGGIAGYMASGGKARNNSVESGAVVTAETYSAGGIIGLLETSGQAVENNTSYAAIRGNASWQGGIIGALGNNTYSGIAIGPGNVYSGADYGIGRDEWDKPSDGIAPDGTSLIVQSSDVTYIINTLTLADGIVGIAYTASLDTTAPSSKTVTWTYSGTFPSGLTGSTAGIISGTPTTAGDYTFLSRAYISGYGYTKSADISISINASADSGLTLSPSVTAFSVIEGDSFTQTFTAKTGITLTANNLPDGLSYYASGSSITITGTPEKSGTFTIIGTSGGTTIGTVSITITVIPMVSITTTSLSQGTVGVSYSASLAATTNATGTLTWEISSGSLPDGLSLSASDGIISGTPTATGSSSFTVQVTLTVGSVSYTDTQTLSITIAAAPELVISTDELPEARLNRAYSADIEATASASWKITDGALPDGLKLTTLNGKGRISGTPAEAEDFTFTVTATAGTLTAEKTFTLTVNEADFSITTGRTLRPGIKDVAYTNVLTTDAAASLGSRIWYIDDGSLPPGLRLLRESGTITGTPTEEGTYTFRVRLFINDQIASKTFTMTIIPGFSIINDSALTPGIQGSEYFETLSTDAPASLGEQVWYIEDGSLPPGLVISRDSGVISGTPTEAGTYSFTVMLLIGGQLKSKTFSLTIIPGFTITTDPTLKPGIQGVEYLQVLSTDAPASLDARVWYIDSGTLPTGLKLDRDNGIINGTPEESGTFTFRVRLLIGSHITGQTFTLLIIPGFLITTETLPDGKEGQDYEASLTASGDITSWNLYSGTFPPGLSLSTEGKITGIPTRSGEYEFTVRARSGKLSTRKTLSIKIDPAFMITTSADLASAKIDSWYSLTLESDASQPASVRWKIISGDLPQGLKLNSETGNISGTPLNIDTYVFTVQATFRNFIAVKRFSLPVAPALEILGDSVLRTWKLGKFYNHTFTTDSEFPVRWTLTDGSLPDGLLFSDGKLSGTPTFEGTYTFTLTAEAGGLTASKTFTLTIGPALSITTPSLLPSVKAGTYYSYTLSTDAEENESVIWFSSSLPSGLYIEENTGTIYGLTPAEGTYTFTVSAMLGEISVSKEFTLPVKPRLSITTDENLPNAEVYEIYSVTLSTDAEENNAVIWSLTAGSLPEGLSLDAKTGVISGYALAEGKYTFTIQAFMNGLRAEKEFVLTAGEAMTITTPSVIPVLDAGKDFALQLETDKIGAQDSLWSLVKGILPPGLTIDPDTGLISGRPSRAGKYTFTVQNVSGYSVAQKEFTITVSFAISSDSYLPDGKSGSSYSYKFNAEGAGADILWSIASDALPMGLTLNADGLLSGTTNESGTYHFMIYAFISNDLYAQKTVSLTIASFSMVPILTTSLPDGKVSEDYYAELRAGIEGVTWKRESGDFPPGLEFMTNGVITGIPSKAGTFSFIVKANTSTREGTRNFSIKIEPEDIVQTSSGGGGGGCNAGINIMMLAVLIPSLRKRMR